MKWSERLASSIALADSLPQELRDKASISYFGSIRISQFCEDADRIVRDFIAQNYPGVTVETKHDYGSWAECIANIGAIELRWSKRVTMRMEDHE